MRVGIREVSQRLASNAEAVAMMLLPGGKKHGQIVECAGTNGHAGHSLKVHIEGPHAGKWRDWAGDEKGDLIDLWASAKSVAVPEALRQAKAYLGIREEPLTEKTYAKPKKEHPAIAADGKAFVYLTGERKLPAAIVNRFKIKGNAESKAIAFPSYTPAGELVNFSYRTLTPEKEVWQDKGCPPCLFGWHALAPEAWERREVLICEGQIDAMSWAAWGVDALSIPNGGGRTWIDYEWENLEAFTTIYLAFDMDGAGQENLRETISRLGKHRCRVVKIPEKDANDALRAGRTAEEARQWLAASEYVKMPHLCGAGTFTEQVVDRWFNQTPTSDGYTLEIFTHKRKEKTFRFRNGELTVWTGTTGHGKSTLINGCVAGLAIFRGEPALFVSLEQSPVECLFRIARGTDTTINNPDHLRGVMKVLDRCLMFYDRIGHVGETELFDLMSYAHARHGVRDIVIDSLMRIDGMEEDYPRQTAFVVRAVTFARETGCHVHLVAHPRKSAGDASPRSQDIAGSGNLRNNADNVLVLWRNIEKERKIEDGEVCDDEPDAIVSVEKDRIVGEFRKFALGFDSAHYRYSPWLPEPHP